MNREDIIRLVRQAANEEMQIAVLSISELEKYTALVEAQRKWIGVNAQEFREIHDTASSKAVAMKRIENLLKEKYENLDIHQTPMS